MYQSEFTSNGVKILFSAALENVDTVCEDAKKLGFLRDQPKAMFAIQLLLREICNNAVLHGCRSDSSKKVTCRLSCEPGYATLAVTDEGEGYDWREQMREAAAAAGGAAAQMTSGRGHPIMLAYAFDVLFNEKGNSVSMKIKLA